jgi:hypothetical protein
VDQNANNSDNTSTSSNHQLADLLIVINKYHSELAGTQAYLLNTRNNLGKIRDIDSRQLTEILNRVHRSSVSVQSFYQSIEKLTGQLHSSSSYYLQLLVALHKVDKQLSEYLLPALTIYRDKSRTPSNPQITSQRQNVLNQLDKVVNNLRDANAIVNKIISLVPKEEEPVPDETNILQDDIQTSIDQQKPEKEPEQTENSRNDSLDNNRSANHDSDKTQTAIDPVQMFKDPADLRIAMHKGLNLSEFRLLCANLKVNYDDLEGGTLELKMQTLIDYFSRRKRYRELVRKVLQFRPDLTTREDS